MSSKCGSKANINHTPGGGKVSCCGDEFVTFGLLSLNCSGQNREQKVKSIQSAIQVRLT